jgi:four helix bundle protein
MTEKKKIQSFTDLETWKESHKLVIMIYQISKKFPKEELFALTSQIRRAAISITSNIAEGFSRNTLKDKTQFYCISLGSLTEIQSQLMIARDLKYISLNDFEQLVDQSVRVQKLIKGLSKSAMSHT